jgi:hypothetical protein
MKENRMILMITNQELEALKNAVLFVLECQPESFGDKDEETLYENTEQLLSKVEMLKEVYN